MTEAYSPPPMYDSQFYQECYELVQDTHGIDLHKDVTHSNSLELYKFIVTSLCVHDHKYCFFHGNAKHNRIAIRG